MDHLRLELLTFDVGTPVTHPTAFAELVVDRVTAAWDEGADIVVFPEFMWMGLERFVSGPDKITGVAEIFRNQLWPTIIRGLDRPDKAAVLGTSPWVEDGGIVRNRAPILNCGRVHHQDKIHLTPWEGAFTGGGPLRPWEFRGVRVAVVICLDVEIPEISVALRGMQPDLLLVPSATESVLGAERVGRCADARAVELGCHVGLCHLVGRMDSGLVDENLGRLAVFSPSQSAFLTTERRTTSELFTEGFHRLGMDLDIALIRQNRAQQDETDPSKIRSGVIHVD
jgi:predicted amidohydrolase